MSNLLNPKKGGRSVWVPPEHVAEVNAIRAEICEEYIADGSPRPESNWLYARLVVEIFRHRRGITLRTSDPIPEFGRGEGGRG